MGREQVNRTRNSAVAEGPRDAPCPSESCPIVSRRYEPAPLEFGAHVGGDPGQISRRYWHQKTSPWVIVWHCLLDSFSGFEYRRVTDTRTDRHTTTNRAYSTALPLRRVVKLL